MKITKSKLRKIIRQSILQEQMIKIIANTYSPETVVYNKIANYALTGDIEAALNDPEVNNDDLDYHLDDMPQWVQQVGAKDRGEEDWMEDDAVVPDNWDPDVVFDFMEDLEDAWRQQMNSSYQDSHQNSPNSLEREVIGSAFTRKYFLPEELKSITFQPRKKAGKIVRIDMESDNHYTSINLDDAKGYGTTLEKIIQVLDINGATGRKRRKSVKHVPPMYD